MTNDHIPTKHGPVDQYRRWIRILSILDSCRLVGLNPVTTNTLHVIVYLTEVLAPVWNLSPVNGRVLKQLGTPYFSSLQQDVDRLIGMGLIRVDDLVISHNHNEDTVLLPYFSLEIKQAGPILTFLRELPDEENTLKYIFEIVQSFSRFSDEQIPISMNEDATYGNSLVDTGQVIDLGEWLNPNNTATSHAIDSLYDLSGGEISPAEAIDVYINHIVYRVANER